MVSVDHMLISIFCISVEALEVLCAEAAEALPPQAWYLKPEDLQSPFASVLPTSARGCNTLE